MVYGEAGQQHGGDRGENPAETGMPAAVLDDGRGHGGFGAAIQHPLEFALQIGGGLPAVVRILGEALFHHPLEHRRNHRLMHRDRLGFAVHDGGGQRGLILGEKGALAGEDFVEYAAEGENIRPGVGGLALQLLGSHVLQRADNGAFLRERPGFRFVAMRVFHQLEFREAEVENFDAGFRGQDVGRFEIAMGDRLSMRGFERTGQLNRSLQGQGERQRPRDLRAFHVLHDEVVGTDIVDLADVGMIQSSDGAGLALKPLAEVLGGRLDGDDAVKPRVASLPHFAHAAGADGGEDFVRAECVANRNGHGLYPVQCT
jgi:hypothetical protein